MFTGIIEGLGKVISLLPYEEGKKLILAVPFSEENLTIGQSIAINGVCLTLTSIVQRKGTFFLSHTTQEQTNLCHLRPGDLVNVERPLRFNQELSGHLLTGHVDTTTTIKAIKEREIQLQVPDEVRALLVPKGSVAIDGISLTIAFMDEDSFGITIIPHTWENTNLKKRQKGDQVNIEADIIAKYVNRLLHVRQISQDSKTRELTKEKLELSGF